MTLLKASTANRIYFLGPATPRWMTQGKSLPIAFFTCVASRVALIESFIKPWKKKSLFPSFIRVVFEEVDRRKLNSWGRTTWGTGAISMYSTRNVPSSQSWSMVKGRRLMASSLWRQCYAVENKGNWNDEAIKSWASKKSIIKRQLLNEVEGTQWNPGDFLVLLNVIIRAGPSTVNCYD